MATTSIAEGEVQSVGSPSTLEQSILEAETQTIAPHKSPKTFGECFSPETCRVYAEQNYGYFEYFVQTLSNESHFISQQSKIIRADGSRELSFGCAQIYEPAHPDITREQAMNCQWSIDWAGQQFEKGNACIWTEYRKITGQAHLPIKDCKQL